MSKVTKSKRATMQPMTMTEFRAWLKGITDMQPDDWHPNLEQWNTIRSRLDHVTEVGELPTTTPQQPAQPTQMYYPPQYPTVPVNMGNVPQHGLMANAESLLAHATNVNISETGISGFA